MTKSNNMQITDILNNIYNLILNPETTENERKLLVSLKMKLKLERRIVVNFLQSYAELFKF